MKTNPICFQQFGNHFGLICLRLNLKWKIKFQKAWFKGEKEQFVSIKVINISFWSLILELSSQLLPNTQLYCTLWMKKKMWFTLCVNPFLNVFILKSRNKVRSCLHLIWSCSDLSHWADKVKERLNSLHCYCYLAGKEFH